jgi:hypothetical protein
LFSWKAALMYLGLFSLSGIFMVIGNYQRDFKKAKSSKRGPYVGGYISAAAMAGEEAARYLCQALKKRNDTNEMLAMIGLANQELTTLRMNLSDVKRIKKEE